MSARQQIDERRDRGLGEMFRALRHRNFLLFWSGAFLSNTGTWMQAVAQGWLVLSLSNSPFWLGGVGFMGAVSGVFFTPAGRNTRRAAVAINPPPPSQNGFMATVPGLFLTLAGGVFADLFDRRKLLI